MAFDGGSHRLRVQVRQGRSGSMFLLVLIASIFIAEIAVEPVMASNQCQQIFASIPSSHSARVEKISHRIFPLLDARNRHSTEISQFILQDTLAALRQAAELVRAAELQDGASTKLVNENESAATAVEKIAQLCTNNQGRIRRIFQALSGGRTKKIQALARDLNATQARMDLMLTQAEHEIADMQATFRELPEATRILKSELSFLEETLDALTEKASLLPERDFVRESIDNGVIPDLLQTRGQLLQQVGLLSAVMTAIGQKITASQAVVNEARYIQDTMVPTTIATHQAKLRGLVLTRQERETEARLEQERQAREKAERENEERAEKERAESFLAQRRMEDLGRQLEIKNTLQSFCAGHGLCSGSKAFTIRGLEVKILAIDSNDGTYEVQHLNGSRERVKFEELAVSVPGLKQLGHKIGENLLFSDLNHANIIAFSADSTAVMIEYTSGPNIGIRTMLSLHEINQLPRMNVTISDVDWIDDPPVPTGTKIKVKNSRGDGVHAILRGVFPNGDLLVSKYEDGAALIIKKGRVLGFHSRGGLVFHNYRADFIDLD